MKTGRLKAVGKVCGAIAACFILTLTQAYPVELTWSPNPEENIGGYNVYVSDAATAYPPVDVKRSLTYTLNVEAETPYWVYVTAYNTNGFESGPSAVLQLSGELSCQYAVHPAENFVGPWGYNGTFRITTASGCPWRVEALDDWISIGAGSVFGQGMTEVSFNVAPNPQPYPRQGRILVQGHFFTVYQSSAGFTPVITSPLQALSTRLTEGDRLELSIDATDESELRYQWYKDGIPIAGATYNYYIVDRAGAENEGSYTVGVSSAVTTLLEGPVSITVYSKPRIPEDGHPKGVAAGPGEPVYLSVAAFGPDLRYQWFKDGVPISLNSPSVYIAAASTNDYGRYHVIVSNAAGSAISKTARVFSAPLEQLSGAIAIAPRDDENFRVEAVGVPGTTYRIEGSTDLRFWFIINTVQADENGRFPITLPRPSLIGRWFVRTLREE